MTSQDIIGAKAHIRGCDQLGEVQAIDVDPKYGRMAYVRFVKGDVETGKWWPEADVMLVEEPKQ
jgi:hypothetical protein